MMNNQIVKRIEERLDIGARKYGHQMNVHDGRRWIVEALEEMLDGMVYITSKLIQIEQVDSMIEEIPLTAEQQIIMLKSNNKLASFLDRFRMKSNTKVNFSKLAIDLRCSDVSAKKYVKKYASEMIYKDNVRWVSPQDPGDENDEKK